MSSAPPSAAPAPPNPELVIRKIGDSITIFSVSFARGGTIPFGGRSTAIQLADKSIWLVPSHPLCPDTYATIQAIGGPVKHLAAPDLEHTMYLKQYAKAFPEARLYVPAPVADKWEKAGDEMRTKPGLFVFGKGQGDPFVESTGGEIRCADFGKAFANQDIAFLHVPSKTLIEADLLFNLPPTEQYSKSSAKSTFPFFSSAMKPGTMTHKRFLWHLLSKDKAGMSENAKLVSSWDFDRIIPCHGDVIETGGKAAWDSTFEWHINGKH